MLRHLLEFLLLFYLCVNLSRANHSITQCYSGPASTIIHKCAGKCSTSLCLFNETSGKDDIKSYGAVGLYRGCMFGDECFGGNECPKVGTLIKNCTECEGSFCNTEQTFQLQCASQSWNEMDSKIITCNHTCAKIGCQIGPKMHHMRGCYRKRFCEDHTNKCKEEGGQVVEECGICFNNSCNAPITTTSTTSTTTTKWDPDGQVSTKHRGLRTVDGWISRNSKWFEMVLANDKGKVEEAEGCAGKGHGRTMAMKVCVDKKEGQGCPQGLLFCYESRMKVAKRTAQFRVKFDKDDSGRIVEKCNWAKLENKTSEEKAKGNETKPDGDEQRRRHGFRLDTKGIGNQMKLRIETTMADEAGGGQVFSTPLSPDGCALFHFDAPSSSAWSPSDKGSPSLSMGLLRNRTLLSSFPTLELFVLDLLMGVGLYEKEVLMVHQHNPNCRMRVTFHPGCKGKECLAGTNWAEDGDKGMMGSPSPVTKPNTGGGNITTTDPAGR